MLYFSSSGIDETHFCLFGSTPLSKYFRFLRETNLSANIFTETSRWLWFLVLYARVSLLTNLFKGSLISVLFPNSGKQYFLSHLASQGRGLADVLKGQLSLSRPKSRILVTWFELLYYSSSYLLRIVISWEISFFSWFKVYLSFLPGNAP